MRKQTVYQTEVWYLQTLPPSYLCITSSFSHQIFIFIAFPRPFFLPSLLICLRFSLFQLSVHFAFHSRCFADSDAAPICFDVFSRTLVPSHYKSVCCSQSSESRWTVPDGSGRFRTVPDGSGRFRTVPDSQQRHTRNKPWLFWLFGLYLYSRCF